MRPKIDAYSDCAPLYAKMVTAREEAGIAKEPIIPRFLELLGDVSNLETLDAGCGEGYLSRILAERGARVTGLDISPRLIEIARSKDSSTHVTYQVADLSQPQPTYHQRFDLIVSHFVMNDVYDYKGFINTLSTVAKTGGRVVFSMNNPYSFVVRNHITNYFDSGTAYSYRGMAEQGVKVYFYQHTLQEYIDAFLEAGFQLQRLVDIPTPQEVLDKPTDKLLPSSYQFPYFMLLSFVKA